MGVFKKGKYYWIDFYVSGRRVRESTRLTSKRRADQLLAKRKAEVFEGRFNLQTMKPGPVFEDFAKTYLESYSKLNKAPQSYRRDCTSMKKLAKYFGQRRLTAITPILIEHYKRERLAQGKQPSTINRELACLKHLFSIAITWKKVLVNPVKLVKLFHEDNQVSRVVSIEEENALLTEAADHLRPILVCALDTGMRLGEILSLNWDNVELERSVLHVVKTKTRRNREIPISGRLGDILRATNPSFRSGRVFRRRDGKPIRSVREVYKNTVERAGLPSVRFHDLRHTFATRLVLNNVDLFTVKELLGHSTIVTTQRYAHPNAESKRAAIAGLTNTREIVQIEPEKKRLKQ
ncbi:MAG: tyrosine-type recombinase/integrase [Candidatus Krumholzibacteriota bacterium]|nr:tyrosine-type recombinase/integrase [Candidatus Krumholzibacteriota bacterium]